MGWLVSGAYHPQHRKQFNILAAQISGAPTNTPLAKVIASDADLAAGARSDAHDLAITKADGTTELDYERVAWNSGTGALEIWFKAPDPESGDDYYLYYGDADQVADRQNATGVWSNNYVGAWHLSEASDAQVFDSTSNNNDSSAQSFNSVGGKIGQAADFVPTDNDQITIPDSVSLDVTSVTYELWLKLDSFTSEIRILNRDDLGANRILIFWLNGTDELRFLMAAPNTWDVDVITVDANIGTGAWYYITATYPSGGTAEVKVNSVSRGSDAGVGDIKTGTEELYFARDSGGGNELDGQMDEVRISSTARSADWIATCYANQVSSAPGGTFWSALGSEESFGIVIFRRRIEGY